jgi:hypothetical protein
MYVYTYVCIYIYIYIYILDTCLVSQEFVKTLAATPWMRLLSSGVPNLDSGFPLPVYFSQNSLVSCVEMFLNFSIHTYVHINIYIRDVPLPFDVCICTHTYIHTRTVDSGVNYLSQILLVADSPVHFSALGSVGHMSLKRQHVMQTACVSTQMRRNWFRQNKSTTNVTCAHGANSKVETHANFPY